MGQTRVTPQDLLSRRDMRTINTSRGCAYALANDQRRVVTKEVGQRSKRKVLSQDPLILQSVKLGATKARGEIETSEPLPNYGPTGGSITIIQTNNNNNKQR